MLQKIKKSNTAIKKEVITYKAALDVSKHANNKDKVLIGRVIELNNSHNLFFASRIIIIAIDNDLNVKK